MDYKQQAILARDMIDMIRDYADNADVLEYLDGFAFALARGLKDETVVSWDSLAGICDQRYYSMKYGDTVMPLDMRALNDCERMIQKFLPQQQRREDNS